MRPGEADAVTGVTGERMPFEHGRGAARPAGDGGTRLEVTGAGWRKRAKLLSSMSQDNSLSAVVAKVWGVCRRGMQACSVRLRQAPRRLLILAVAGLLSAATLLTLHKTSPAKTANLHIVVQHGLRSAQLRIWIDDRLAYQGRITGTLRKRFGLIPTAVQGSFTHAVQVASGKHTVRMQVTSPGEAYDEVATLQGQFPANADLNLLASAHRHDLALAWQGTAVVAAEADPPWYVKSLLMTMAGSIFSAVVAFVLGELPKLARSGGETISKA
jgi:hypothetical protein